MLLTAPASDPRTTELPQKTETNLGLENPDESETPDTYVFHLGYHFVYWNEHVLTHEATEQSGSGCLHPTP